MEAAWNSLRGVTAQKTSTSKVLSVCKDAANLLIPRSSVLLEKLTVTQPVQKFLVFYGNQRFITQFTRAHH